MNLLKRICFSILLFPIVFIAIGLLLLLTSYSDYNNYKMATDVTGIVTKCQYDTWYDTDDMPHSGYDIYIDYTYNGKSYSNVYLKSESTSIKLGKEISFKIHPDNPDKPFSSNPFTTIIIGAVVTIIGFIMSIEIIPHSISSPEFVEDFSGESKSKKRYLFALIPIIPIIVFLLLGINISPLFHIGTIAFSYLTVVFLEILLNRLFY